MSPVETRIAVDLRRAPLTALRDVDLRAPERDFWADEAALWDRLVASWAGLDDAAWHLSGAAPSDAGGPDWSLAEHVGHIAAWQELAIDYTATAIATGRWPTDDDYDGGDFDRFNERLREPWASQSRDATLARLATARDGLLEAAADPLADGHPRGRGLGLGLHDPARPLPRPSRGHRAVGRRRFAPARPTATRSSPTRGPSTMPSSRRGDAAAAADLDALLRNVPLDRWVVGEVTPGWTVRDHVAHLADWAEEGVRAIEVFRRDGEWLADPDEGIDAWNERMVEAARDESPASTLARYERGRRALREAVDTIDIEALRSPDGWSWAYDCLHGHVRKHAAMLGPWCATAGWPDPTG